jgi:hypothetical protein
VSLPEQRQARDRGLLARDEGMAVDALAQVFDHSCRVPRTRRIDAGQLEGSSKDPVRSGPDRAPPAATLNRMNAYDLHADSLLMGTAR